MNPREINTDMKPVGEMKAAVAASEVRTELTMTSSIRPLLPSAAG